MVVHPCCLLLLYVVDVVVVVSAMTGLTLSTILCSLTQEPIRPESKIDSRLALQQLHDKVDMAF